jgi:hypothetical protein
MNVSASGCSGRSLNRSPEGGGGDGGGLTLVGGLVGRWVGG